MPKAVRPAPQRPDVDLAPDRGTRPDDHDKVHRSFDSETANTLPQLIDRAALPARIAGRQHSPAART